MCVGVLFWFSFIPKGKLRFESLENLNNGCLLLLHPKLVFLFNWSSKVSVESRLLIVFFLSTSMIVQDEFRRWFLARVQVMLAPGSNPFHSLETQTTSPSSPHSSPFSTPAASPVANGHTPHPSDGGPAQELMTRFSDYQPTQAGVALAAASFCNSSVNSGHRGWRLTVGLL